MRTPTATAMIESRFSHSAHSQRQAIRYVSELLTNSGHLVLIESSEPQPPVFLNQGMGAYIINWIDSECPETDWIAVRETQSQIRSLSKA